MTTGLLPQGSAHRVSAAAVPGSGADGAKHRSVRADVFDFSERTRASRSSAGDVSSIGQSAGKASPGPPQAHQFDTFETDDARQAHLNGEIPAALGQVAPNLLASAPDIRTVDVIAVK